MNEVELFFFTWKYTSIAFFSSIGFIVAMGRIASFLMGAHNRIVSDAVEQALIKQRQDNQGDILDEFIKVIKEQQSDIKRYCKAKEDDAINSAILNKKSEMKD